MGLILSKHLVYMHSNSDKQVDYGLHRASEYSTSIYMYVKRTLLHIRMVQYNTGYTCIRGKLQKLLVWIKALKLVPVSRFFVYTYVCIIGALCILEDSVYNGSIDQKKWKNPTKSVLTYGENHFDAYIRSFWSVFQSVIVATMYLSFVQHDCCFCSCLWVTGLTKRVHTFYPVHKCASQIKCVCVLSCHNVKTYFVVRQGTFVHKNWLK